jgi:hypothetical protein
MMSFDSFVRLGWAFARVVARNLISRRPQLPRFMAQYAPDGIVPFAPDDRIVLEGASRCIACAQCDRDARLHGGFEALDPRGPMAFVLGVSRHSGEHDAAEIAPAASDELLDRLRRACPVDVPFAPLADLVRRRGRELRAVRVSAPAALPGS